MPVPVVGLALLDKLKYLLGPITDGSERAEICNGLWRGHNDWCEVVARVVWLNDEEWVRLVCSRNGLLCFSASADCLLGEERVGMKRSRYQTLRMLCSENTR